MTTQLLRHLAEHEAAHAVVAAHYGIRVHEIRVQSRSGYTLHEGGTAPQEAAITAAGDTWQRSLSGLPYTDLACSDLATFERAHGLDQLWHAQRAARQILTARRDAVQRLAARLSRDRTIRFVA